MLLRLHKALSKADIDTVLRVCSDLGYGSRFVDSARELLQLEGEGAPDHRARFENLASVRAVLDGGDDVELYRLNGSDASTQVVIGAARFGAGELAVIAGPCAVENEERLLEIAVAVRERGATLLRGGAFKPRTSPYSFQGLGQAGLDMLARVKDATGMGIVTEVLDPRDVEAVVAVADMVQIGTRSMSNFALLKEVGRTRTPVLLKRGFASTVDEWLSASEYILSEGNDQVVLCERGIRGFDNFSRNVLDVGAVAHLKGVTHLPVIVDPSHAAGRPDLVRPLSRAGIAAGADGLLIEVHSAPWEALSDGKQATSLDAFTTIVDDIQKLAELDGRRVCRVSSTETPAPV